MYCVDINEIPKTTNSAQNVGEAIPHVLPFPSLEKSVTVTSTHSANFLTLQIMDNRGAGLQDGWINSFESAETIYYNWNCK